MLQADASWRGLKHRIGDEAALFAEHRAVAVVLGKEVLPRREQRLQGHADAERRQVAGPRLVQRLAMRDYG